MTVFARLWRSFHRSDDEQCAEAFEAAPHVACPTHEVPVNRAEERLFAKEDFPPPTPALDLSDFLQELSEGASESLKADELLYAATDGSARNDIAASAIVFGQHVTEHSSFAAGTGDEDQSAFKAEMQALLWLATVCCEVSGKLSMQRELFVVSDCLAAISACQSGHSSDLPGLARAAFDLFAQSARQGLACTFLWVPSHGKQLKWAPPEPHSAATLRALNESADVAAIRCMERRMQGSLRARWHARVEEVTAWEVKTVRIAVSAIESLVKTVEKGNPQFSMKLNLLRLQQDVIVTTKSGLDRFILCVEQEAHRLSADEDVRTAAGHGNKQQHDDEYVIAKASGKGSEKCWFHSTPEGCSRGRDCPFSHDGPSGAAGPKGSKGKGKGKKGKDHDQSTDAAAKAKAEAKAKAKAAAKEAKAKTKAEQQTLRPTQLQLRRQRNLLGRDEMEQYGQTGSAPSAACWERLHPDNESQALEWQAWECFRDGITHQELISVTSTGQRLHVANYVRAASCDSDAAHLLIESSTASWWCVVRVQHCEPDPIPVGVAFHFADDHAVVREVTTEEETSPEESNLEELGDNSEEEPAIGTEPDPLHVMLDMIDATRYARILSALGVETIEDLDLIREDDLTDIPAVPRRKILEASQAINRGYILLEELPDMWAWAHRRNQDVEHPLSEGEPDAEPFGAKLECRDEGHAQASRAQGSEPWVLVDSGANETIRPWLPTMSTTGCKQTSVTTASGDRVEALRSRDGELCVRSSDDSQEWLLSVRRLVQAGGMFCWDESGALLRYWDEDRKQYMKVVCQVINGLPYITWTDFKPIRILLSRRYKGKESTAASAEEAPADTTLQQLRMCDTCTPEELAEQTWAEEDVTINKSRSELDDVERSEARAKEMLSSEQITRENVWNLVQDAGLKGQRTRTSLQTDGETRPRMWVFGYFAHGGVDGLTALTTERPYLTRVLCELVRRELPHHTFTSLVLAIDATLKPHRDSFNHPETEVGLVGLTEFKHGELWIEDVDGNVKRRVTEQKVLVGRLLSVSGAAVTFNGKAWHGAEAHQGIRSTISAFPPSRFSKANRNIIANLSELGFKIPTHVQSVAASAVTASTNPKASSQDDDDGDDHAMCEFEPEGLCEVCGAVCRFQVEPAPEPSRDEPWPVACTIVTDESGPVSSFQERARSQALNRLSQQCSKGLYERRCPKCLEAHGHKRKCRRLDPSDVSKGTLSMDLSGPHPTAFSGHRYFLVANLCTGGEFPDIPFVRLLQTKKTGEVAQALSSIMCQIVSLSQGVPEVFRIHSDAGKEFVGKAFITEVQRLSLWPTTSVPYSPQQNGKAERLVGLIKSAAASLLLHGRLPLKLWSEAVLEACFLRRQKSLQLPLPADRPKMGAEEAIFLANEERAPGGARVMVKRGDKTSVRIVRLPVLSDQVMKRWRVVKGPAEGQMVWVSTEGDLKWDAPPIDMLTVEEAAGDFIKPEADDVVAMMKNKLANPEGAEGAEKLFTLFGHGFLVHSSYDAVPSAVAAHVEELDVNQSRNKEAKDKYYILAYRLEEEMNEHERTLATQAQSTVEIGETVPQSILTGKAISEAELEKWLTEGVGTELENLASKDVYDEVEKSKVPAGVKPIPAKLVLKRKPVNNIADEVEGIASAEHASLRSWQAKARLVACGNWEKGTTPQAPENQSLNPGAEAIRIAASLLARHQDWTGLVLDISAAFLNAKIQGEDVYVSPPPALVKRNIISGSVLWKLKRALYGLRRSPKLWEHDRDAEVEAKRVVGPDGQCLKLVRLEPGVWKVIDESDVDQNPLALAFMESWTLKIQGMLCFKDFAEHDVFTFSGLEIPVRSELTFLGCELKRDVAGVFIHQTHWLEAELVKRGLLHLKGSASLPELPEGTISCRIHVPDVAAVTGGIACIATLSPTKAVKLAVGVWRYLLYTKTCGLWYHDPVHFYGDASLGVGASRSRTGALVTWGQHVITWRSCRQSITAWSAFEAEVDAGAAALEMGIKVRETLERLTTRRPAATLYGDNAACLTNLLKGHQDHQATRTRHFGLRCSWVRDQAVSEGIAIKYMSGTAIPADSLTKILGRKALEQARPKLSVVDSHALGAKCETLD
ncbi:unnamed protein product [Symbiodinium sp. CCMP2592]|nr:unnamed protein product [Symbiodinium sp. CCMP2592]